MGACLTAVLSHDRISSRDISIGFGRRESDIYGVFASSQTATHSMRGGFLSGYQNLVANPPSKHTTRRELVT